MRRSRCAFALAAFLSLTGFDWPAPPSADTPSRDEEARCAEVRVAARSSRPDAVAAVVRALADPSLRVRFEAVDAAVRAGRSEASSALLPWLDDERVEVRRRATEALGALGARDTFSSVARMLSDVDLGVRLAAIRAVASLGGDGAVVALVDRLSDPEVTARGATAHALGTLGDARAVFALLGALQDNAAEVRAEAAQALASIGDGRALPGVVGMLHDPDVAAREAAVRAVGTLAADRAEGIAALAAIALRESDALDMASRTRLALVAIDTLRATASRAATEVLLDVLRRARELPDRAPAREALRALASPELRARVEVEALTAATPIEFRDALARALGDIGGPRGARALLAMLDRGDLSPAARAEVLRALGDAGDPMATLPLLAEAERLVRRDAAGPGACASLTPALPALLALDALASRAGSLDPGAFDLLTAMLDRHGSACAPFTAAVLRLLGDTRNDRAREALRPWLAAPLAMHRAAALDALARLDHASVDDALLGALTDVDEGVRRRASALLTNRATVDALPALLARWDAPSPVDRAALALALARAAADSHATDRDRAAAHAPLARCLADASPALSSACASALATLRTPDAIRTLRTALDAALDRGDTRAARPLADALADLGEASDRALPTPSLRAATLWGRASDDALRRALDTGTAAELANALAALRHRTEPLDPALAASIFELLRTRRHVAVLTNAALALAATHTVLSDLTPALHLLAEHPHRAVRRAVATLLVAAQSPAARVALTRCAREDRDPRVRDVCRAVTQPTEAPQRIDARLVDAAGDARPETPCAIERADGWIRMTASGPDGWIHDADAPAGEFVVRSYDELAGD